MLFSYRDCYWYYMYYVTLGSFPTYKSPKFLTSIGLLYLTILFEILQKGLELKKKHYACSVRSVRVAFFCSMPLFLKLRPSVCPFSRGKAGPLTRYSLD